MVLNIFLAVMCFGYCLSGSYIHGDTNMKTGTCTAKVGGPFPRGTSSHGCINDLECPGKEKCCYKINGFGFGFCSLPLEHMHKTGDCPTGPNGSVRSSYICRGDYDCPGNQKCCDGFLGHKYCSNPVRVDKPGFCPRTNPLKTICSGHRCMNDINCPTNQKCCIVDGCRTCVPPRRRKTY